MTEFIYLKMVVAKTKYNQIFSYHSSGGYEEKKLQKLESYRLKSPLQKYWITVGWDKMSQPQKWEFLEKRERKLKT